MTTTLTGNRAFQDRVRYVRQLRGYRYSDLATKCSDARSSAWFNNLINGTRWTVGPPSDETISDLATLLEVTPNEVRAMIAEEWYGIVATEHSARVRGLAPAIDDLTDADFDLVANVATRLRSQP